MVDESGLELGLGLSCGGSWSKSKAKDGTSDPKRDEGNAVRHMGNNITVSDDSFKNFFKSGSENHDPKGKQKSDPNQYRQENFFTDLSKCSSPIADCSNDARSKPQFTRYQELWISSNRTLETEEEKSSSSKRKLSFEEINFQNKHEKLIDHAENHGKNSTDVPSMRNTLVSITMEDGTTGDNEDAAESEAEGPKSWLVLPREEKAKCSEAFNLNGKHVLSETSGIGSQCQKEACLLGNEPKSNLGKVTFGIPLMLQSLPVMNGPYPIPAMLPSTSSGPNAASLPSTCVMQLMPIANGERPVVPVNTNDMQLSFSYPSVQRPTLEKGSSWAFNSQSQYASSFTSRKHSAGAQNQENFESGVNTSEGSATKTSTGALSYDGKSSDLKIGMNKYVGETCESAQADGSKPRNTTRMTNEATNKPAMDGFFRDGPSIKPGIAPYLEFGGCGSYPDLPWVSTTGHGPNGKTISGVTYKYNQNEIKVVCACHGIHMSQEEFVQHASGDGLNSQNNPNLSTFPSNNTKN